MQRRLALGIDVKILFERSRAKRLKQKARPERERPNIKATIILNKILTAFE